MLFKVRRVLTAQSAVIQGTTNTTFLKKANSENRMKIMFVTINWPSLQIPPPWTRLAIHTVRSVGLVVGDRVSEFTYIIFHAHY